MNLATLAAILAYIAAILFAKGWLFSASFANALACVAAGLLLSLLAGFAIPLPRRQ